MIKLDVNKEKTLEFSVSIIGRFSGDINSYFRIYCDDFNIGFPAKISNFEQIVVKLPKLIDYINPSRQLPEKAQASLEIIQDRDIFLAWRDEVKFKQSDIKAKLSSEDEKEEKEVKEVKVKAVLKDEDSEIENPLKKDKVKKEEINPELSNNLLEAFKNGANEIKTPNTDDFKKKINEKKAKIEKSKIALKIQEAFKQS